MIEYLASLGYYCKGTEITRNRGAILLKSRRPTLEWGVSDGIRLDMFEKPESYDIVLSKDVIEHLHPDDIQDHFRGVYSILKPRGRYVFSTSHKSAGPSDISKVFKYDRPMVMHLREYTYRELADIIRESGFSTQYAPVRIPGAEHISAFAVRELLQGILWRPSETYLNYLCSVERVILRLPHQSWQRFACMLLGTTLLFIPGIFMIAQK
jgi:SAM-dependent methyltransferase